MNKHLLCYILQSGVNIQDMKTLIRHMLHNGHLAEQTNNKKKIHRNGKKPSRSTLLKVWLPVRSDCFTDANSYTVASPLIIVGKRKQK